MLPGGVRAWGLAGRLVSAWGGQRAGLIQQRTGCAPTKGMAAAQSALTAAAAVLTAGTFNRKTDLPFVSTSHCVGDVAVPYMQHRIEYEHDSLQEACRYGRHISNCSTCTNKTASTLSFHGQVNF